MDLIIFEGHRDKGNWKPAVSLQFRRLFGHVQNVPEVGRDGRVTGNPDSECLYIDIDIEEPQSH